MANINKQIVLFFGVYGGLYVIEADMEYGINVYQENNLPNRPIQGIRAHTSISDRVLYTGVP